MPLPQARRAVLILASPHDDRDALARGRLYSLYSSNHPRDSAEELRPGEWPQAPVERARRLTRVPHSLQARIQGLPLWPRGSRGTPWTNWRFTESVKAKTSPLCCGKLNLPWANAKSRLRPKPSRQVSPGSPAAPWSRGARRPTRAPGNS